MIITLEDSKGNPLRIEVMEVKTNKGIEFKGVSGNIILEAFLNENQQFLTENDVKINGDIETSIEDIVDQMNEFFEVDY